MKTLYIIITLVAGILFFSCEKEEIPDDFEFGIEKSFQLNGEYQSTDRLVKFKLTEINDSRCPSDVVCVWEGMVSVKLSMEKPVAGIIELNSYNNTADTLANYVFELMDVLPYPISTQTTDLEDYEVILKVKKTEP